MASLPHVTEGERIGLIAGNGRFPIIFADNAKKLGYHVSAVAHEGETEPELAGHVDRIHWIKIGQLNITPDLLTQIAGWMKIAAPAAPAAK